MTESLNRGQQVAADITALLRARNSLLWIVTREESRVERYLFEAASKAGFVAHTWDVAAGPCDMAGNPDSSFGGGGKSPDDMLAAIADRAANTANPTRDVWIMRDLPAWLVGPAGAVQLRQLRNLARSLPSTPRNQAQAVIVLTPSADIPADIAGSATVIEWPLPDRAEIAAQLDSTIASLPAEIRDTAAPNGTRDSVIDSAVGLSGEEAAACFAKSLVQTRRIEPAAVASEKRRVIAKERVLEWFEPLAGGLDSVGGLDNLKSWLQERKSAYSTAARAYGLPSPKGVLLVGVPGCGKSLSAKAIATAWQVPLLRLDMGALKSKFVGESEGNLRKAFSVIAAIGRCVVWIDEIEKALGGASGPQGDGGVASDALGAILNFMQERQGESFVIATANDVSGLPPELLRKGRFDELFFIDLPNVIERGQILTATLRTYGRQALAIDLAAVAQATDGFTGSEVAALVPDAMFAAFNDGSREISTADIVAAIANVSPLSKMAADKIQALRSWSKGKARPATSTLDSSAAAQATRQIDL